MKLVHLTYTVLLNVSILIFSFATFCGFNNKSITFIPTDIQYKYFKVETDPTTLIIFLIANVKHIFARE